MWQFDLNRDQFFLDGRPVLTFAEDLPALVRMQVIARVLDDPDEQYHRGLAEGAESRDDPPSEDS